MKDIFCSTPRYISNIACRLQCFLVDLFKIQRTNKEIFNSQSPFVGIEFHQKFLQSLIFRKRHKNFKICYMLKSWMKLLKINFEKFYNLFIGYRLILFDYLYFMTLTMFYPQLTNHCRCN